MKKSTRIRKVKVVGEPYQISKLKEIYHISDMRLRPCYTTAFTDSNEKAQLIADSLNFATRMAETTPCDLITAFMDAMEKQ